MQSRAYLSAEQLAALTPWSPDAIEKMVRRGTLARGVHYFQPAGRRGRLLFKWDAIVALIECGPIQCDTQAVIHRVHRGRSRIAAARKVLDVEKTTTSLQRLLD